MRKLKYDDTRELLMRNNAEIKGAARGLWLGVSLIPLLAEKIIQINVVLSIVADELERVEIERQALADALKKIRDEQDRARNR